MRKNDDSKSAKRTEGKPLKERKGRPSDDEVRQRLQLLVDSFFGVGPSQGRKRQQSTAEKVGVSQSAVSRAIIRLVAAGKLQFVYDADNEDHLEAALLSRYGDKGLRGARVVVGGDPDKMHVLLGRHAAKYSLEHHLIRAGDSVGIGCGTTVLEFAKAFPNSVKSCDRAEFWPLVLEMLPEDISVAPATIIGILSSKFEGSRGWGAQLFPLNNKSVTKKLREAMRRNWIAWLGKKKNIVSTTSVDSAASKEGPDPDVAIFGLGPADVFGTISPRNQFSRLVYHGIFNGDEKMLREQWSKDKVVGEIIHIPFDRAGEEVAVPEMKSKLLHFMGLQDIKELVEKDKTVLLLGGGEEKRVPIKILLEHGLCSHLVTDAGTAEFLINAPENLSQMPLFDPMVGSKRKNTS